MNKSIGKDVLAKPLFCWMIAYTFQHDKNLIYEEKLNPALIYLSCFHSIIEGRHKKSIQDSNFDFNKQHIKEKSILRKIAALKQIYGDSLTYGKAREKIKKFEGELSEDYDKVFGGIVSSYFYSGTGDKLESKIEFMHKSFREFFLAEYFIESIIADRPHRLNLGISSGLDIVLQFLNDLLKIIVTKSQNNSYEEVYSLLIDSLRPKYNHPSNNKSIVDTIIENSKSIVEREILVYRSNLYDDNKNASTLEPTNEEIWAIKKLTKNDYHEMFQHRWISMYCLTWTFYYKHGMTKDDRQEQQKFIVFNNTGDICAFIRFSGHLVTHDLKSLMKCVLSNYCNLTDADLSRANLYGAYLSDADLSRANLSHANLTDADLYNANLSHANLSYVDLSYTTRYGAHPRNFGVNLYSANLHNADLYNANLSDANLYGAYVSHANLLYILSR